MKSFPFVFALALIISSCQQPPSSGSKGMASLLVRVRAEPKTGSGPSPQKVNVYDVPKSADIGAFTKVDYFDLENIVVWLEPPAGISAPSPAVLTVNVDPAKSSTAIDDVASVGQQIVVHNASASPQTIYSVSDGNDFDFESVPANGEATYTVHSAGLIEILNASTQSSLRIYAAPSPWVRLAHSGQTVAFKNLSPGQYHLACWHPRLPGSQAVVTLTAGHTSDAAIEVSVNSLPKVTAGTRG